jgi:hypothetical protein
MSIPADKLKTTLTAITKKALVDFARLHADEVFYGFAFDCNPDYCEVLLCLNTEEDLSRRAKRIKEAPSASIFPKFDKTMEERFGIKAGPRRDERTIDQIAEELRWSTGDWKYQGFYNCNSDSRWDNIEEKITEDYDEDSDHETFMETVCLTLKEIDDAISLLNCSTNFRTFAISHDESIATAWKRLDKMRA